MRVLLLGDKNDEKILRARSREFDFNKRDAKEIKKLVQEMKSTMKSYDGIGLAANQVGITERLFIAQLPAGEGRPKFYAIFNPVIEKVSGEMEKDTEGCLSIPGVVGSVERDKKITLSGLDKAGKKIKLKAFGLLARVFQHEIDHLDGVLFIDKAKSIRNITEGEGGM